MFTGMEWMACQQLAVAAEVMQHVVQVESNANPYAIGVVGGRLLRQPRSLDEALATVRMLDSGHYNYSLGLAQVSRTNLRKYGLDSYQQAFSACPNLAAGAQILAACHVRAGGNWGSAFSCYYSGDFVSGYRDGYVQKVYASMERAAGAHGAAGAARAAPSRAPQTSRRADAKHRAPTVSDNPDYRIAIRSTTVQAAPAAMVPATQTTRTGHADSVRSTPSGTPPTPASGAETAAAPTSITSGVPAGVNAAAAFVPQVSGPNDSRRGTARTGTAAVPASSPLPGAIVDRADLRKEHSDGAFVF